MSVKLLVVAFAAFPAALQAVKMREGASRMAANPVRKVVTMLQAMQTKVSEEGEKEADLYKKFNCYCKTSGGDLADSVSAAEGKVPTLTADITAVGEQKVQTEQELSQAKTERAAAKAAMDEATAIREKEAAAFAAEKAEAGGDVASLEKAIAVIEKGVSGAFLQTPMASKLKKLALATQDMASDDRQTILSFLSGEQGDGYAPQSGEIVGILKQMMETMAKGLAESTKAEEEAISSYEGLMAAKKKELDALTAAIETKTARVGELAVSLVEKQNDLDDTEESLAEDKKFLANLESTCAAKATQWEERQKTRADELAALAETIKVLNDDDALDLFKKTLPSAATSFVQVQEGAGAVRQRALAALRRGARPGRVSLDFIALALRGKKVGFEKVVTMIDDMAAALKQEQTDDDNKKDYCGKELDLTEDAKKGHERSVAEAEAAIASAKDSLATLAEEMKALETGIKALDKSVAEATEQRKAEHAEFTELMASDSTAKELIAFAKNRLNKFYNPKLYVPPPKRELSEEDRIVVNMGGEAPPTEAPGGIAGTGIGAFVQISSRRQLLAGQVAPPPPPETFGAYATKSQESTGVIAMMDLLVKDLDKEMTEAETSEKDAQADYEIAMKDSAEKRASDSKALGDKGTAKADGEAALESHKESKASASKELMSTMQVIQSLHTDCDWLIEHFDVRKEARSSEIESLGQAKAVLSGADYSLLQLRFTRSRTRGLRGWGTA
mmetsp:Transcript_50371/g.107905  ORF Transcript_50371/g.107905 Transcript_50371/m.107905 type:complete len:732 (-) Transcript_50371:50-2245(-)